MRPWTRWKISGPVVGALVVAVALVGGGSAMAQGAKPIKIGFGMALTGGLAANGKAALLAMQIWKDDVNKKGGLLGRPIEFVYYDDQTNPATVPGIYTKLLDVDKVDLVVSGYGTNLIAPAMPLVIERKLTFMGLFGLANNEKYKYPRYFQISPNGPNAAAAFSDGFFELAAKQNPRPKTVALVGADAEFPHNALAGARDQAKKYGLQVVYDKTYPPNTVDYTPIVRAIKATSPDIVFVASYPPDSAGMVLAAHEVGLEPKLFGGRHGGPALHRAPHQARPQAERHRGLRLLGAGADHEVPGHRGVPAEVPARGGQGRRRPARLLPAAVGLRDDAGAGRRRSRRTKGLDQRKLADYMHAKEFDTIVGKVKFGADGEWAKARTVTMQFQNIKGTDMEQFRQPGRQVIVYPDEFKSGNLIYPYSAARK